MIACLVLRTAAETHHLKIIQLSIYQVLEIHPRDRQTDSTALVLGFNLILRVLRNF